MESLPREIKECLVRFLDDSCKRMMRLANTQWFSYIKYNNYEIHFMTRKSAQEIADRLSKYSWPLHIKLKKSIMAFSPSVSHEFMKLTNVESLEIDRAMNREQECGLLDKQIHEQPISLLTNLTKLAIEGIFGDTLRSPIRELTNLTSLHLSLDHSSQRFDYLDNIELFNMTKLRELSIVLGYEDSIPLSFCPTNLTKLRLTCNGTDERSFDFGPYPQLKSLELRFDGSVNLSNLPPTLERFGLKAFSMECDSNFINHCERLTTLCVFLPDEADVEVSPHILARLKMFGGTTSTSNIIGMSLVEQLEITSEVNFSSLQHLVSSLEMLSVQTSRDTDFSAITQFSNLTQLKVVNERQVELSAISHLTKLRHLTLYSHAPRPDTFTKGYAALTNLTYLEFGAHHTNPDLGDTLALLTRLVQLKFKIRLCETELWHQMARLTTLADLHIATRSESPIEEVFLLLDLTRLTRLHVPVAKCNEEEFQRFTQLSNLQRLILCNNTSGYLSTPTSLADYRQKMPYLLNVVATNDPDY